MSIVQRQVFLITSSIEEIRISDPIYYVVAAISVTIGLHIDWMSVWILLPFTKSSCQWLSGVLYVFNTGSMHSSPSAYPIAILSQMHRGTLLGNRYGEFFFKLMHNLHCIQYHEGTCPTVGGSLASEALRLASVQRGPQVGECTAAITVFC